MIRVYVIEDNEPIIVSGLKRMFYASRDGIEVVGSSKSVEDAIKYANPEDFDIFILDLWLETRLPIQDIQKLRQAFQGKNIMMYTDERAIAWNIRMLEEGALAFVNKNAERTEIKAALKSVAVGKVFYPPVKQENISQRKALLISGNQEQKLSPTQMEIINMLAKGQSHKVIADVIGKKKSGLEDILRGMRKKFNARNNIEMVTIVQKMV